MRDATSPLYDRPESDLLQEIEAMKQALGGQVLILGHHYQREEVIRFADITGDSLKLARQAAATDVPNIIFCGVHFMAETADILTSDDQRVFLPDPAAGCSMADMADEAQVQRCWQEIGQVLDADAEVTPVTYINSTAALKAFCGRHGGIVCTSSNAEQVLRWAWSRRRKVLFFPDQHLGENTALRMGVPESSMLLWDPALPMGGHDERRIREARLLLWKGFCSVHQMFQASHVATMREQYPDIRILAHPECSREVCERADFVGSTEAIIAHVHNSPKGSTLAIATELNLVNRLRLQHPERKIFFLSPMVCMCSTMFRTDPQHLLEALQAIADGRPGNRIVVPSADKTAAKKSLRRMLDLA